MLTYRLKDGSAINCTCIKEPYLSQIINLGRAERSPPNDWQPIETAPKDVAHILAASSAGFQYIVLWDEDRSIWVRQDNETPCFPHNWQPLPAPPRRESVYSPTR